MWRREWKDPAGEGPERSTGERSTGGAPLQLIRRDGAGHRLGLRRAGCDGVHNLHAPQRGIDFLKIFLFAQPGIGEGADEPGLREIAKLVPERRFIRHRITLHAAGDSKAKAVGLGAEHDITRQCAGQFREQTGLNGLTHCRVGKVTAPSAVKFHRDLAGRHALLAGADRLVAATDESGGHVTDTPERESGCQEDQKNLHNWRLGTAA